MDASRLIGTWAHGAGCSRCNDQACLQLLESWEQFSHCNLFKLMLAGKLAEEAGRANISTANFPFAQGPHHLLGEVAGPAQARKPSARESPPHGRGSHIPPACEPAWLGCLGEPCPLPLVTHQGQHPGDPLSSPNAKRLQGLPTLRAFSPSSRLCEKHGVGTRLLQLRLQGPGMQGPIPNSTLLTSRP